MKLQLKHPIVRIYGLAAASLLALAMRDMTMLGSPKFQGASLLAELILLNAVSSALTDYTTNNTSWLSKKQTITTAVISIIAAAYFLFTNNKISGAIAFVTSSLCVAYICSQKVLSGKYSYPSQWALIETFIQLLLVLSGTLESISGFIYLRVASALTTLLLSHEESAPRASNNRTAISGQIISTANSGIFAYALYSYFNAAPPYHNAILVRITSYGVGGIALAFNILADRISTSKNCPQGETFRALAIAGTTAGAAFGLAPTILRQLNIHLHPDIHAGTTVSAILFLSASALTVRIFSRVQGKDDKDGTEI
jgi:hypothetical protein